MAKYQVRFSVPVYLVGLIEVEAESVAEVGPLFNKGLQDLILDNDSEELSPVVKELNDVQLKEDLGINWCEAIILDIEQR